MLSAAMGFANQGQGRARLYPHRPCNIRADATLKGSVRFLPQGYSSPCIFLPQHSGAGLSADIAVKVLH
jgi:hypothetical protein